jgi:hypothetical protein
LPEEKFMLIARLFLFAFMALYLSACSVSQVKEPRPIPVQAEIQSAPGNPAWRYARLGFARNQDGKVDWHLDGLAASEIFAPVLRQHGNGIPVWRFHRRAGRDAAGHQFSLIIYSDETTATAVMQAIRAHPLIAQLKQQGHLRKVSTEIKVEPRRNEIGATSDPQWSEDMQRSWPWFAMGGSQAWLALLQEQLPREMPTDFAALVQTYASAHQAVNERWREQGGHAYLHHLNALFGYQTLKVRMLERGEVRF